MYDDYNNHNFPNTEFDDYLMPSILVTIFCCLPFGVPAIVFAAMAKGKMDAGDNIGARRDSETAKNWCIAAFVAGLLAVLISVGGSC